MKAHLKTLNSLAAMLILFSGCTQGTNQDNSSGIIEENEVSNTRSQNLIESINSWLPREINDNDYFIIYRTGSIEFSSDHSVLCLNKSDIGDDIIRCKYFMLNNIDSIYQFNNQLDANEPKILGFDFKLKSNDRFPWDDVQKLEYAGMDAYLDSLLSNDALGEGHCDNVYYCSYMEQKSIVNTWKLSDRDFIKNLFIQISPSEYYQAYSLSSPCDGDFDTLIELFSEEMKERFLLYHVNEGRYW